MASEDVSGVKSVTVEFVTASMRVRLARACESSSEADEWGMVSRALRRYL